MLPYKKLIPVNEPSFQGNEKVYINQCIDSGWISSAGTFVKEFETKMATLCHRTYSTSTSSGTAALDIVFKALNLKSGDEVITSDFSIISCTNSIIKNGATPVLVDVSRENFNMSAQAVIESYTNKTKAILIPHIYGLPVDLDPILEFADEKKLIVIEDAAEMHGQSYKGKPCGSFGDISIFSFYCNKHITTGEGGMILTNNKQIYEKCHSLKNHSFMPGRRFVHDDIGFNYRMTNIQAAIGLAQAERLPQIVNRKREIGKLYTSLLRDTKGFSLPIASTSYAENIYWVNTLIIDEKHSLDGEQLISLLKKYNVDARPGFWPLHAQPIYIEKKYIKQSDTFKNSKFLANKCIYLPSGLALENQEIEFVASVVKEIFKNYE